MTALAVTAYREAVEAARARPVEVPEGTACLTEALGDDWVAMLGRARWFFTGAGRGAAVAGD